MATLPTSGPASRPTWRARIDHVLHEGFANEGSPLYQVVNGVIVVLIFVSIISVALESVPSIYLPYRTFFEATEWIIVSLFTLEYLINIYVAHDRLRYVFGIWGIVDLLAILPSLLLLFDLRALKVGRVLSVLRFLRLMRILRALKLAKMASRSVDERRGRLDTLKMDLQIYFIALFSAVSIFSTLEYYAEEHVPNTLFTSIPQSMWWCFVTLTTTGYGDMYPATVPGRLIAAATMLTGLALFGLLINVVGKLMLSSLFGASDLEAHDEAARNAASLLAQRRRLVALRGLAGGGELSAAEQALLETAAHLPIPIECASCSRLLEAEWAVCPHCGTARS